MNIARLSDGPAGRWVVAPATFLLVVVTAVGCATTPSEEYRFDVLQQPVRVGPNTDISVRLVHLPSGQNVNGATITKSELEMPMLWPSYRQVVPSGLSLSNMHVEYLGSDGQGTYRFRGDVSMSGTWTLKIWAQVPGETESIRGAVRFNAVS